MFFLFILIRKNSGNRVELSNGSNRIDRPDVKPGTSLKGQSKDNYLSTSTSLPHGFGGTLIIPNRSHGAFGAHQWFRVCYSQPNYKYSRSGNYT